MPSGARDSGLKINDRVSKKESPYSCGERVGGSLGEVFLNKLAGPLV